MVITTQEQLAALLKLCRKQGVTQIKLGDVEIKFGELPKKRRETTDEQEEAEPEELSDEHILEWALGKEAQQ